VGDLGRPAGLGRRLVRLLWFPARWRRFQWSHQRPGLVGWTSNQQLESLVCAVWD